MKEIISLLGIVNLFDPVRSELKGISDGVNLSVGDFFHNVNLIVGEEGTDDSSRNPSKSWPVVLQSIFKNDLAF